MNEHDSKETAALRATATAARIAASESRVQLLEEYRLLSPAEFIDRLADWRTLAHEETAAQTALLAHLHLKSVIALRRAANAIGRSNADARPIKARGPV